MNENKIPVFLASDDNYAPFLCTTLYSVLMNTKSFIDFYILDNQITDKSKLLIKQSLKKFSNYSIEYIDMTKFNLERFPSVKYYSINTYSRYFIPELKPNLEKVLYLDVDIIAKGDIKKLYEQDLEMYPIGAVSEGYLSAGIYVKDNIKQDFNPENYFNAGVILMDIKQFVENGYENILIDKTISLKDKTQCADQDIFNIFFENNYKKLDYIYNYMPYMFTVFKSKRHDEAIRASENCLIIHYAGPVKPWQDRNMRCADDFVSVANKTAFRGIIKRMCIHNKPKEKFIEKIFSIKNTQDKKHKVITLLGIKVKFKRNV